MSVIKLTIAICTYNRAGYLKDTLADLAVQSARPDAFEILVIDNNSTDHTTTVCSEFAGHHPELNFRCITETEQGLSPARNRAAEEASSAMLLYIDDDVHLPKHFAQSALDYISKYPGMKAGGGRIFVSFDDAGPDWIPKELMPMFGLHDLGDEEKTYPRTNFPRGGNMLIHKQVFKKIGMFDPELGRTGKQMFGSEEKAFFDRARKNGIELYYLPKLELHHRIGPNRLKMEYIKKQSVGIGQGERRRLAGSPIRISGKMLSELVKFAASTLLAAGYVAKGRIKAARFILIFRVWVLKGFWKRS